jgi:4-hydroxybenzoate polyprenyltransferase
MMKYRPATAKDYIQAIRPQNSMLTALALALPVLILRPTMDLYIFGLLVEGFLLNSAASIHNNICDFSYDMKVSYTSERVVGTVIPMGRAKALYASILALATFLGLLFIAFNPFGPKNDLWALVALLLTMGIVSLYNVVGKTHFIWGLCISLGIASLVWFGAVLAGSLSNVALFILLYLAFQSGFMQNLEGGLKDVATDVSNMAASLGVRVKGKKLRISGAFAALTWLTKAAMTMLIVWILFETVGLTDPIALFEYFLTALSCIVAAKLLSMRKFDRAKIIRFFGYHEALMWVMVPVLIYPLLGPYLTIFVALLPLFWYLAYNRIVHGDILVPDI